MDGQYSSARHTLQKEGISFGRGLVRCSLVPQQVSQEAILPNSPLFSPPFPPL